MNLRFVFWIAFCSQLVICTSKVSGTTAIDPPEPAREFRGLWVAVAANIDWPYQRGSSTARQKADLIAIMDRAAQLKLNAIIFQVRPQCDAVYASPFEPWSEYLTGTMGKAPEPYYDPLAFAVEEAHKRGLELHAWFNPYRALHASHLGAIPANHVSRTHPSWVKKITSQNKPWLWLDPGERDAQAYSLKVIMDVVKRYDIDGVQFDDYFYPDQDPGPAGPADFPDDASWKKFGENGKLKRADWRRENVNAFVEHVYLSIKTAKPWVKFGISPRGIWSPGNPPQIKGTDDFNEHYADSRKWLANGWLDYFSPQLYWAIEPREQSFPVLLKWWSEQNTKGRHLWPGLAAYRVKAGQWQPEEIRQQIEIARAEVNGYLFFSASNVVHNASLSGMLEREVSRTSALIPASPWLGSRPDRPVLNSTNGSSSLNLSWQTSGTNIVRLWVLQTRSNEIWNTEILPANRSSQIFRDPIPDVVAVSAVDRAGNRSHPALMLKPPVVPAAAAPPAAAPKPAKRETKRYQSPKATGQ